MVRETRKTWLQEKWIKKDALKLSTWKVVSIEFVKMLRINDCIYGCASWKVHVIEHFLIAVPDSARSAQLNSLSFIQMSIKSFNMLYYSHSFV